MKKASMMTDTEISNPKMTKEAVLHYLKVLKRDYAIFQPELRAAIDIAHNFLERDQILKSPEMEVTGPACGGEIFRLIEAIENGLDGYPLNGNMGSAQLNKEKQVIEVEYIDEYDDNDGKDVHTRRHVVRVELCVTKVDVKRVE